MQARQTTRTLRLAFSAGVALVVATPLAAQSGAKILTPPRPADTAARPAVASRPATAPGASAPAARPAPVIPQSPVLDSVRMAVFHNLLDRDRAGFSTLASAFCLSLSPDDFKKAPMSPDRVDPPESMVRQLSTPRTPARRASTCTFTPNAARPVAGRALLYSVGAIDLSNPDRVDAAAGYNYDGYSAGGYTFTLERSDSGWVVKQWRMEWTARTSTP